MGARGAVPKRSSERRRRNSPKPDKISVPASPVKAPELTGEHSDIARRFWKALSESGQAQFYEPSDWAQAEIVVIAIDAFVEKPTAMMLASLNSAMAALLVTEGDRRRMRLEIEREPQVEETPAGVTALADYRRELAS